MNENFGKFLAEKRKEAKLTQKQLAEKLFVTESTVSKWEGNKANPDISMVSDIAKFLNISEHELITASIDTKERALKSDARKWNILSSVWDYFFIISYAITLFTCFVCNLAVNKTLSWFFIVLTSIILASSFTTVPKFIKKNKLLFIPLIELLSLILLLFCCVMYSDGDWFLLAITPIIASFIIVFTPIYIAKLKILKKIKKHNALISVSTSLIVILIMLSILNAKLNGNWFVFSLILTLFCFIFAYVFVFMHYIKIDKLLKSSILTFIFAPFLIFGYIITNTLCLKYLNVEIDKIQFPNFANWTTDVMISSNVASIICLSIIFASLIPLLLYGIKRIKNSKK